MFSKHYSVYMLIGAFFCLFFIQGAFAQNIINGEYFFDSDPGIENGEPISFTPSGDIANHIESIDISTLDIGAHQLFIRTQDDTGQWAIATVHNFAIQDNPSIAQITAMEYFYDVDPGEANGIDIPITASVDINNFSTTVNTSGISNGIHSLFIRSKDANEKWSLTNQHVILKQDNPNTEIIALEYFFDTDPGQGNANDISITSGTDINDLMPSINSSGLSVGSHLLGIRSKDNFNQWSHVNYALFLQSNTQIPTQITELEYFFDSDPGEGNGNDITITPGANIVNLMSNVNTSGISNGTHLLGIRSKDNLNQWSHLNYFLLLKTNQAANQITALEYYIGNDPGAGNGNAISITPGNNIINLNASISTSGLASGTYFLHVRSKDDNNNWSHVSSNIFFYTGSGPISDIVEIEYFFGLDPGKGNATSIAIAPNSDITNLSGSINTSSIQNGANILHIRSKSGNNRWSHTNQFLILKRDYSTKDIAKIEYYFDQDPGKGNATEIPVTAAIEINDLSSVIDVSTLPIGPHILSIRSQEIGGEWSLDQHFLILKQPADIPYNIQTAEYFIGEDPGKGNGQALTVNPGNQIILIQTIDVSNFDLTAQEIHVRTKDGTNRWSHDAVLHVKKRAFEAKNITQGEYFFDSDPGLNMATAFTIPAEVDISDLDVIIMANGLPSGLHDLYIRTKEEDNKWSLTNVSVDILMDQALPLNWLSFDLFKLQNAVKLQWKVAQAENTSHFHIEKQINGVYSRIALMESFNHKEVTPYNYLDYNPLNGWNYYRIEQVDLDGKRSFSETRSVFFSDKLKLSVFPNPTVETIHISGIESDKEYEYTILDASNKLVKQATYSRNSAINLQDLPPGPYFLLLKNNNEIESFLIVKQ